MKTTCTSVRNYLFLRVLCNKHLWCACNKEKNEETNLKTRRRTRREKTRETELESVLCRCFACWRACTPLSAISTSDQNTRAKCLSKIERMERKYVWISPLHVLRRVSSLGQLCLLPSYSSMRKNTPQNLSRSVKIIDIDNASANLPAVSTERCFYCINK